jgi:drug/metabolite transporter (DMT)-like permease
MSALALGLVLTSAFLHASWNLFAKKVSGGMVFTTLMLVISVVLYAPVAVVAYILYPVRWGWLEVFFIGGSACIHLIYFLVLQRGYKVGDLSLIYPLARGTGPLLSTVAAILLLGERPSPLALFGVFLLITGVFALTWSASRTGTSIRTALVFGLITGFLIACYNLWDKQGLTLTPVTPVLFYYFTMVGQLIGLLPFVARPALRADFKMYWRDFRKETLGAAIFSPLSYFLYLVALSFSPVSYVAPAREISILFGVVMGAKLLAEGDAKRRLLAAGAMVGGVVALALG